MVRWCFVVGVAGAAFVEHRKFPAVPSAPSCGDLHVTYTDEALAAASFLSDRYVERGRCAPTTT